MVKVMSIILVLGTIGTAVRIEGIRRHNAAEPAGTVVVARLPVMSVLRRARRDPAPQPAVAAAPVATRAPRLRPPAPARSVHPSPDQALVELATARVKKLEVPTVVHGVFFYAIGPGDWVEEISRRFGVPLQVILDVNGIDRETVLHDGDLLCLPIIEYSRRTGLASWYGPGFDKRKAANGYIYDQDQISVAALHYPFNLRVEIERRDTRKKVTAQVLDRGPYYDGRIIDLSKGAARALESVEKGVVEVVVRPFNDHLDAIRSYLAGRTPIVSSRL